LTRGRPERLLGYEEHAVKHRVLIPWLVLAVAIAGFAASGDNYYDRLMQVSNTEGSFIWNAELVDVKNTGPVFTNASIPFSKFSGSGELAGIKFGMTMSEVVSIWGKPERLVPYMEVGPRLWYGSDREGRISLSFKDNRLVLICIDGSVISRVPFDNGLSSNMGRGECEKLLGVPFLTDPDRQEGFSGGEIYYLTNGFRTDVQFWHGQTNSRGATDWLSFICVRIQKPSGNLRPKSATNLFDLAIPSEKELEHWSRRR
jgi:hypothetical protein